MAETKAAMVAGGAFVLGACFGACFYQGAIKTMFARKQGKKMFTVKDWDAWGFKMNAPNEDGYDHLFCLHRNQNHNYNCYSNESDADPHHQLNGHDFLDYKQEAKDVHHCTLRRLGGKNEVLDSGLDRAELAEAIAQDFVTEQQFSRNRELFGKEGQLKVHKAFVVVVGLGGVGSHAALHLIRSGISNIRLIDHDVVTMSSLNRNAVACRKDVGVKKATVTREHFDKIYPECNVDARAVMFTAAAADELLAGDPDFVLDCIDNIDTKVALLRVCVEKGIPVISATGAGTRMDVTRVRVVDIKDSAIDPLARAVRQRLRRYHHITEGIKVVISTEPPRRKPLQLEECVKSDLDFVVDPSDYQQIPNFRIRTIPVCSPVPAVFGAAMAAHVVAALAEQELHTEPVVRFTDEQYRTLYDRLLQSEEGRHMDIDLNDVVYVVRELWQGRSARDPHSHAEGGRAMFRAVHNMGLTRWDKSKPLSVSNLVLLSFDEMEAHDRATIDQLRIDEPEFYGRVTNVLKRAAMEVE